MPAQTPPEHRFLARQFALGFGAVGVVAVVMCGVLLGALYGVSDEIAKMRRDESTIRQGLDLATAVREMSLHIAHSVIEGDRSHLSHYASSRDRVRSRIQQLSPAIPERARPRLQTLAERTQRMHELLMGAALPAAERGDLAEARRVHRQLDELGREAAEDADVLARAAGSQMAHAHTDATAITRAALVGGGVCIALVVALAVGFTVRLRNVVIRPLSVLSQAAQRFGRGEFDFRVGAVGRGELAALGSAFDHMADELAQREQRLLRQERMAAIGQLAAGVAHELNNPIGIIRGYLDTMNPDGDRATLREEISILDEEANHCQRIAADLVSYARSADIEPVTVAMAPFLEAAAKRFRETPAGQDHPVTVDAAPGEIEADPSRLRQVVMNLLTNAGQMSPDGEPIELLGRASGDGYRIEVRDRGPGVPEEDRAQLFEPFVSRRPGGSGLGLAVCMGIVRAHGGSLAVTNADDVGARFAVELPGRAPAPDAAPAGVTA